MAEPKINEIIEMMAAIANDSTVPKNIRKAVNDAKIRLESNEENNVKVSAAIYMIDSISDDINMPAHARTQIWGIVSALESAKK
jgi:hypothetical protein